MAAKYDDKTARGWPLPHRANRLYDDVERLREALNLIDETITGVEVHEGVIEDEQSSLNLRLDTILEGATEDSEILDARVDAQDQVHPNLGHNLRNLHRLILELDDTLTYEDSEFQGLLSQFGSVAEAQIQYELDEQDAHQRRKNEILQEALTRYEQDEAFQKQVNSTSEGIMHLALLIQDVAQKRRDDSIRHDEELHNEINSLDELLHSEILDVDEHLQAEINSLAEACLRDTFNLYEAIERRKSALKQEIEARIAKDTELQSQINENARSIQQEESTRAEADKAINEALAVHEQDIGSEAQQRIDGDSGLAHQVDANAEANIRNTFYIQEVDERRKVDISREEKCRTSHDKDLQQQINTVSQSSITNALNLADEAQQRRKLREALDAEISERTEYNSQQDAEISRNAQGIDSEAQERVAGDLGLARQTDANAEGNIHNALNLSKSNEQHRDALIREEKARITSDENLQAQINKNAEAGIDNALSIHQEAQKRRLSDERIDALDYDTQRLNDVDGLQQEQIDAAILSILQNTLTLSEALSRGREALHREEQSRLNEDAGIQSQVHTNAEANMRNSLNIQQEAEKRRELLARLIEERQNRDNAIRDLRAEIGTLYEIPLPGLYESLSGLQDQSDKNAQTGILNALNIHEEAQRRRETDTLFQLQINESLRSILDNAISLRSQDSVLQEQINTAVNAIMLNTLNLSDILSRQREALKQEALARTQHDSEILSQVKSLALADLQQILNTASMNSVYRNKEAQERQARLKQDDGLQAQMNQLAIANMWLNVHEHETHQKIQQLETDIQAGIISIPGRAATDEEFDEMLDKLYDKP